jgi:ABC-type transport system involved in cytochrome c biogenesis permease subunit
VIEWFTRKTAMRGLFALGGAVSAMVALMAAHFLPVQLNSNIGNMMPVLHDVWLYIHTNVVIFSYALIFMAAVSAFTYLVWRLRGGGPAYARVGGAGQAMELAAEGGAHASVHRAAGLGEVLDGVTMLLTEVSFVMLWAGIVMGAIWADHSWGRPWGWDPKENGALMIVLWNAAALHARWDRWLGPRGFALFAIGGNIITAWSWFGTNQLGIGLHAYGGSDMSIFENNTLMLLAGFVASQLLVIAVGWLLTRPDAGGADVA